MADRFQRRGFSGAGRFSSASPDRQSTTPQPGNNVLPFADPRREQARRPPAAPASKAPAANWGAIVEIELAPGTVRHPGLLDQVRKEAGRIVALDLLSDGVTMSFGIDTDSRGDAQAQCDEVTSRVLDLLGLSDTAVAAKKVFERDLATLDHSPHPVELAGD